MRRHPVQEIIEHYLRKGEQPPEFRKISGKPYDSAGMSWFVKTKGIWSHVVFQGKLQFIDGRLM